MFVPIKLKDVSRPPNDYCSGVLCNNIENVVYILTDS